VTCRPDTLPTAVGTNYATALLLDDDVAGSLLVLRELGQDTHPSAPPGALLLPDPQAPRRAA